MRSLTLAAVLALCLLVAGAPWVGVRSAARLGAVGGVGFDPVGAAVEEASLPGGRRPHLDVLVLLDLLDAAIAAGVSLPRALGAVGGASGGVDGDALARAASALVLGATWRTAWVGAPARLDPVIEGLAPTWETGAAPGPALRAAAAHLRTERRTAGREAAGRLGVHLVLPLGLCFLPAFVLIGLVPVLVSLGSGLLG